MTSAQKHNEVDGENEALSFDYYDDDDDFDTFTDGDGDCGCDGGGWSFNLPVINYNLCIYYMFVKEHKV